MAFGRCVEHHLEAGRRISFAVHPFFRVLRRFIRPDGLKVRALGDAAEIFLCHLDDVLGVKITHVDGDRIVGHIKPVVEFDEVGLVDFPQVIHPAEDFPMVG